MAEINGNGLGGSSGEGPQIFRPLGRHSLKEIAIAAVLASGLAAVILLVRLTRLDKGLAAHQSVNTAQRPRSGVLSPSLAFNQANKRSALSSTAGSRCNLV